MKYGNYDKVTNKGIIPENTLLDISPKVTSAFETEPKVLNFHTVH